MTPVFHLSYVTIQEVPQGDGKAEKEAQEKELKKIEEGSTEEGEEEMTLEGIKKRSTGSGRRKRKENKARPRGHRRKRYILRREENRWTKGILPYVYDTVLGEFGITVQAAPFTLGKC